MANNGELFAILCYNKAIICKDNTVGSLTSTQQSIVVGSVLGDGCVRHPKGRKSALFEVNHSYQYREYVDWKYETLKEFVRTPPKKRKNNGKRIAYRFTTLSFPEMTQIYNRFYVNGKKIIPNDLYLDPVMVAVWFMDDGCKSYNALYLNTQQFDRQSQEILMQCLDRLGIKSTLNKDKIYHRIRIRVESVPYFISLVRSYIHPMFQYKIG